MADAPVINPNVGLRFVASFILFFFDLTCLPPLVHHSVFYLPLYHAPCIEDSLLTNKLYLVLLPPRRPRHRPQRLPHPPLYPCTPLPRPLYPF